MRGDKVVQFVRAGSWKGDKVVRIVRVGSWGDWEKKRYRAAYRNGVDPVYLSCTRGFRVVRVKGDNRHGV